MDDRTIILHWDDKEGRWFPVTLDQWISFRRTNQDWRPLSGALVGEHCFVVCIVDRARTLFNIIPHRFQLDDEGRITHNNFDDLSTAERSKLSDLTISTNLSDEDKAELLQLQERQWRSNLPTLKAAKILMRELPGVPADDTRRPVWDFLKALGMVPSTDSHN